MSTEWLKQYPIPVPPLSEQQRIVAELDCINGIIEKKKQQLKELDTLAQSIFYDMFGDPITNEKGWEVKKLGEICDIINGKNQKQVECTNGKYPIYGSGGVMAYANSFLCKGGSTIIGRKGTINRPIFVNEAFWNVDTAFGLQPKENCKPYFLFYMCKNIDFTKYDKSVTIPSLVKSDLIKIPIPLPPLPLQQSFAAKVEAIEKQKSLIKQSIAEAETLLASRMDYYFN